jgi:hypothetical protein
LAKAGRDLWHDCDAMPAARIFFQLIADFVVYLGLLIRPRKAIAAENLFLRRQLALYQERKVGPRRIDPATRITPSSPLECDVESDGSLDVAAVA